MPGLQYEFEIELAAFIFGVAAVYLSINMRKSNYIANIISAVMIIYLLLVKQTYAMAVIRFIIILLSIKGFVEWKKEDKLESNINKPLMFYAVIFVIFSAVGTYLLHLATNYNDPVRLLLDGVGSCTALFSLYLQTKKYLYAWWFWIFSDFIGCLLMLYIGFPLLMIQYIIFMILSYRAYLSWKGYLKPKNTRNNPE